MTDIINMIGGPVAGVIVPVVGSMGLLALTAAVTYFTYKKKKIPIVSDVLAKGKYKRDAQIVGSAALICACLAVGAFGGLNLGAWTAGGDSNDVNDGYRPLSVALTISPKDIVNSGTTVGGTVYTSINNGPWVSNPGTFAPGDKVRVWVSNRTTYDCEIKTYDIITTNSVQTIYPQCAKNATKTLTAYDTTNHVALTDGGSAAGNVTVGAGGSVDIDFGIQGSGDASTGPMTLVFELSNKSSQDVAKTQVTQGGAALSSSTGCPTWYTPAGVNSGCVVVNIPAVTSSATATVHLNVPAVSASTDMSSATIKMTPYSQTGMLDSSSGALRGQVYVGVADSGDTIQSINYQDDFTVYLNL